MKKSVDETIEDTVEKFIKQDNPQSTAVKHLVGVAERDKTKLGTDVELKTDLTADQIITHSVMAVVNSALEMDETEFNESCILGDLIDTLERKSISKDRKSRGEIVAVARNPDTNITEGNMKQSFMKRFFSPKPPPQ